MGGNIEFTFKIGSGGGSPLKAISTADSFTFGDSSGYFIDIGAEAIISFLVPEKINNKINIFT